MCSALRCLSEGSAQDRSGRSGVTLEPTVIDWWEEGALHQGIAACPEGLCLRVFSSATARE